MKATSKTHILQELIRTKYSIIEIKEVFRACEFELSLEFITSGVSHLTWEVSARYISGILQAHVDVKISKDGETWNSKIPVFFKSPKEVDERAIERELVHAVKLAVDRLSNDD